MHIRAHTHTLRNTHTHMAQHTHTHTRRNIHTHRHRHIKYICPYTRANYALQNKDFTYKYTPTNKIMAITCVHPYLSVCVCACARAHV